MKRTISAMLVCALVAMAAGCAQPPRSVNAVSAKRRAVVAQPNEYFDKGDYDRTIEIARQMISSNASDGAGWYWLCAGHFMKRQYADVIPAANNVLRLAPNDQAWAVSINNSYYYLGFSFLMLGKYDEAERTFNKALDRHPTVAPGDRPMVREYLIGKAFSALGRGENDTAVNEMNKAKEMSDYPNYAYHLSLIYYATGNKEKAWEHRGGKGMVGAQVKDSSQAGTTGAEIVSVVPGGPAEKAGLLPGDIITSVNEHPIVGMMVFMNTAKTLVPGKTATLTFVREGMARELPLQAASAEAIMDADPLIAPIVAKRKAEAQDYQQAASNNTIEGYAEFLRAHPATSMRKNVLTTMSQLIKKQEDPTQGYKKFLGEFQDGTELVPFTYRLSLVGPEGMRVGDILGLLREGIADRVIAAKIRMQNGIYKDFDGKEMVALKKMGITDVLIEAMLDSTTRAKREQEERQKKKDMENLLAEIQHAQKRLDEMKAAQNQQQSQAAAAGRPNSGPSASETLTNCASQVAALEACKHLPWPANSVCASTAKAQFPCQ